MRDSWAHYKAQAAMRIPRVPVKAVEQPCDAGQLIVFQNIKGRERIEPR